MCWVSMEFKSGPGNTYKPEILTGMVLRGFTGVSHQ